MTNPMPLPDLLSCKYCDRPAMLTGGQPIFLCEPHYYLYSLMYVFDRQYGHPPSVEEIQAEIANRPGLWYVLDANLVAELLEQTRPTPRGIQQRMADWLDRLMDWAAAEWLAMWDDLAQDWRTVRDALKKGGG